MSFNRFPSLTNGRVCILAGLLLVVFLATPVNSQLLIDFTVGSNVANPGDANVAIPIYLQNTADTVAGFSFWLQLSHPGLAHFQMTVDTIGTLISGWQYIDAVSFSGTNLDIKVIGLANIVAPPFNPGLAPQDGSVPLLNLYLDVVPIPDTMVSRTADIIPNTMLDHFGFSDPQGNLIGVIVDSILDTNYFVCNLWSGPNCVDSSQVSEGSPYDWMIISWDYYAYLDTSALHVTAGFLSVLPEFVCGDFTVDGEVNISDLTTYVDYMFAGGPLPQFWQAMDCDGDEELNVIDLTCFVEFMFAGGPAPICLPPE